MGVSVMPATVYTLLVADTVGAASLWKPSTRVENALLKSDVEELRESLLEEEDDSTVAEMQSMKRQLLAENG